MKVVFAGLLLDSAGNRGEEGERVVQQPLHPQYTREPSYAGGIRKNKAKTTLNWSPSSFKCGALYQWNINILKIIDPYKRVLIRLHHNSSKTLFLLKDIGTVFP